MFKFITKRIIRIHELLDLLQDIKHTLNNLDHFYHIKKKTPEEMLHDNIFQKTPLLSYLTNLKRGSSKDEKVQSESGGSRPTTTEQLDKETP